MKLVPCPLPNCRVSVYTHVVGISEMLLFFVGCVCIQIFIPIEEENLIFHYT